MGQEGLTRWSALKSLRFSPMPHAGVSEWSRSEILVRENAVERRLGALSPLLASTRKHYDEVSTPRGIRVLKTVEGRPEGFVSFGPERERDVVVGDLGLRIPQREPEEVVGRHPLGAKVRWVFEPKKGPPVMTVPQRPPRTRSRRSAILMGCQARGRARGGP